MDRENEKEDVTMNAMIESARPCTILESLEQSCKEVKAMRESKAPKRSWKEFASKMKDEISKDKW